MDKMKSPSPGAYVPEGRQAPEKASESGQSEAVGGSKGQLRVPSGP